MGAVANSGRLLSTSLTTGKAAVPTIADGNGVRFRLTDGREVIDASNTSAPLGHQHPAMVQALREAASSPVVNEGWSWTERDRAADELIHTVFRDADWVGGVRFFLSASEANDAALSLSQALTGRKALATRERAYHGLAGLAREVTVQPQWHGGLSNPAGGIRPAPAMADVHVLPAPSSARITGQGDPTANPDWMADARNMLGKTSAVILDYTQGGVYHDPKYQDRIAKLAAETGAIWIADETVTGLGRTAGWLQFEQGYSRPDMVTMGKPLAGGGAPAGALVLSRDVVADIGSATWETYSTFRAHPSAVSSIRASLRAIDAAMLTERSTYFDRMIHDRLLELANKHPGVQRIDGRGLHWTIEMHGPSWREWRGEEAEPLASQVVLRALDNGVLLSTSNEQTSLFVAPPLIIEESDLMRILDALDDALYLADTFYTSGEVV